MRRVQRAGKLLWILSLPLLVYLLSMDLVFLGRELAGHEVRAGSELMLTAAGAAAASLPLGLWYWQERKGKFRETERKTGGLRLAVCSVLAGAGMCLFLNGVLYLWPLPLEGYHRVSRVLYQPPLTMQLICMGLVIPAGEELVFRGLGYARIRSEFSAREAMVVSALWFGLYHGNLLQGIYAGLVGLLAADFYEAGGLWACWMFHGAANVTAIFGTLLFGEESFRMPAEWKLASVVLGGGLLLFCIKIRRDGEKT